MTEHVPPINSISYFPCQPTDNCGDNYADKTNRQLSKQMSERTPKRLVKSMMQNTIDGYLGRNLGSYITNLVLTTKNKVGTMSSLGSLLCNINFILPSLNKSVVIQLRNLVLRAKKLLVRTVQQFSFINCIQFSLFLTSCLPSRFPLNQAIYKNRSKC